MNRSYSLTSASKPPKQCLMNCLFNRDKLKLTWSCARLSKCSASGYHCCTTPGLWTKRCPQGQQFRGGTIGRVKTDRMPGWSDVNWAKVPQVSFTFSSRFPSNVFFATQHSAAPPSGTSRTAATILPPWQDLRHITDTDTADTMPSRICPRRSTDCSRMVIPSHNLKGIPSVNATCEIALNYITV